MPYDTASLLILLTTSLFGALVIALLRRSDRVNGIASRHRPGRRPRHGSARRGERREGIRPPRVDGHADDATLQAGVRDVEQLTA
jgi:hypothetical protein